MAWGCVWPCPPPCSPSGSARGGDCPDLLSRCYWWQWPPACSHRPRCDRRLGSQHGAWGACPPLGERSIPSWGEPGPRRMVWGRLAGGVTPAPHFGGILETLLLPAARARLRLRVPAAALACCQWAAALMIRVQINCSLPLSGWTASTLGHFVHFFLPDALYPWQARCPGLPNS